MSTTSPRTALRLGDPSTYLDGVPHEAIDALRASNPVAWQELDDHGGFWAVLTHADVVTVARRSDIFSAEAGGIVLEDLAPDVLEMMRGMLPAMDPPRHLKYRRPLADSFKASVMARLEPQIRAVSRELLTGAVAAGEVELVHDVTSGIPTRMIGQLMGLPAADWGRLHELAEQQTSGQDPDMVDPDRPADMTAAIEMAMYAIQFATDRRAAMAANPDAEPPADLTTLILSGDFGGQPMSEVEFGSFFVQLVTAGNDTTKTMLSSGVHALVTHPDQMALLRQDPSRIPNAVEEILRWANPLHYFRRTATRDVELGGAAIAAGDKVAMFYTAANRDPAVFDQPHRFDVTRSPNPHLSFGIGVHFCLGAHLARLEGRIFFEELLAACSNVELAGTPVRVRSNLNNAFRRLPIRFVP